MRLMSVMSNGQSYRKIHVDEIRVNKNNFYHEEDDEDYYVDSMAELLKNDGMDANGVLYEDDSINDGKTYTLLSGERRFKATKKNYENGIGDGLFFAKVVKKPENETEEMLRIISANNQRNKSKELRKKEVNALQMCWDELVARGEKPKGRKREWMAEKIGVSPRMIQNYLKDDEAARDDEKNDQDCSNDSCDTEYEELKSDFKRFSKRARELYGVDVKITKKSINVAYEDISELKHVLKQLDLDALVDF